MSVLVLNISVLDPKSEVSVSTKILDGLGLGLKINSLNLGMQCLVYIPAF